MKIHFWGASQTVTGSRYFLTHGNENVLVDCGLFQGLKDLRLRNWNPFPIAPAEIQSVVLTHAHLDHSGYLPLLVKNGFRGNIYATAATRELCRVLLLDSGYLQEEEAKYANRRKYSRHHPALPLYTRLDAEAAMTRFVDVNFHLPLNISSNFSCEFSSAGHLLGAASVRVKAGGRSILFSGDLGRNDDALMREPETPLAADLLVVESTYGNRSHSNKNPQEEIRYVVNRTIKRGGTLLIPSFACGRAQLVLYHLHELRKRNEIPDVPIYLNSPMANSVNLIFKKYSQFHKLPPQEIMDVCHTAEVVSTPEESRSLNEDQTPKIILAASGMATGGRVLHHLKSLAPDAKNSILFAGFQAAGTRGERIVNGASEIKIHGEFWPIRAEIFNLESLSAHADGGELLDWIGRMKPRPKHVFVTHGEPDASNTLQEMIQSKFGITASCPELMSDLDV